MSHTLHRQGDEQSLSRDYTILAMPSSGLNSAGSLPKLAKALEIFLKYNPVNIGDSKGGSRFSLGSDDAVKKILVENELVHAVYRSEEQLIGVLKELKEADLGLSVTVGGLIKKIHGCCEKVNLKPHTIHMSLGVWGKTEKLPSKDVLEISTMCGHHLVSADLIVSLVEKVKSKKMTPEEAGKEMARCCICGIFNPARASEIIEKMAHAQ